MVDSRDALITFSEELQHTMRDRNVTHRQVAFAARVTREKCPVTKMEFAFRIYGRWF